jgi:tetratricopeptide (TPR) repeat protein
MKKIVLAMLLVAAVTAVAQTTPAPSPTAPQPTAPAQTTSQPSAAPAQAAPQPTAAPAAPQQKKEIKDPAEYNAYVGAVQQKDAPAKISGLEAFLTQYPNSVMKEDALELLMGAYGESNNQAKTLETAQKVLLANSCNLRALALLSYTKRAMAEAGQNAAQSLTEGGQSGEKGLQCLQTAPKPEGTTEADFQKLKGQTAGIFNGAAGMAAYQAKDYAKAQQYLAAAVAADPPDANSLRDVYPLALAYLTPPVCAAQPPDASQAPAPACSSPDKVIAGLFFIARAANLAQGAGKDQIAKFGKSKYAKFHGSEEGWTDLMAKAATATSPAGITVTQYIPPTPAQQCADLMKTKKVEEMAFAEWQLCLSEGAPEDAEKVWGTLKGKPLQMVGQILSIESSKELKLAGSSDDIDAKRADINLTMTAAIPKAQMPKEGAELQFEGTPVSYVPKPFVMTMNEGALIVKAAPKKPPVHKKPAAH